MTSLFSIVIRRSTSLVFFCNGKIIWFLSVIIIMRNWENKCLYEYLLQGITHQYYLPWINKYKYIIVITMSTPKMHFRHGRTMAKHQKHFPIIVRCTWLVFPFGQQIWKLIIFINVIWKVNISPSTFKEHLKWMRFAKNNLQLYYAI